MFYNSLKNFIKKFPNLWNLLRWFKDRLIIASRLKDAFMMMILFHAWPEQTYRFSTRRLLPKKENRFSKKSRQAIPYDLLKSKSCKIEPMKEINVVGQGLSFDLNRLKKFEKPTFLLSYWVPLKMDHNGNIIYTYETVAAKELTNAKHPYNIHHANTLKEFRKKNLTYVIPREPYVRAFKKNGYNVLAVNNLELEEDGKSYSPLVGNWTNSSYIDMFNNRNCRHITLEDKIYRLPLEKTVKPITPHAALRKFTPSGSFLPALCALTFFAEKINVYGWDFYLDSSPEKMNYWQLFFNMYKFKFDTGIFFRKSSAGSVRSRMHFESALVNFYYGYRLSQMPNINMHGYMGQLDKHEKLIKKIERVLFN